MLDMPKNGVRDLISASVASTDCRSGPRTNKNFVAETLLNSDSSLSPETNSAVGLYSIDILFSMRVKGRHTKIIVHIDISV